jgi:hypothetical protein
MVPRASAAATTAATRRSASPGSPGHSRGVAVQLVNCKATFEIRFSLLAAQGL